MKRNIFTVGCFVSLLFFSSVAWGSVEDAKKLFRSGKWEDARIAYEKVLSQLTGNEKADALWRIGYCWQITHKHKEALPYFHQVLDLKEIDDFFVANAHLRIGYSYRLLQRDREAIQELAKGLKVRGATANQQAEMLLYSGWAYGNLNEPENAISTFRKIQKIPDVPGDYIAAGLLTIGKTLQQQKKYSEAIAEMKQIADLTRVSASKRSRARVYILECETLLAGDMPFHIKPYVTKVTSDGATLFWVSQGAMPVGSVEIRNGEKSRQFVPSVESITQTICQLHRTELKGLVPNTTYEYEVECGGEKVAGKFKTAPQTAVPFRFSVIGDTQSYNETLQPLLDSMGDEKSDFVLHVGDITDRGELWGEWKGGFFDPGNNYLSKATFWPAYGNHDGGPYFPTLFDLKPVYYYSFDYANMHVVVLDSYGAGAGGRGREKQLEWLKQDLEENDKLWTIVTLHVPMVATRTSLKWFGADDFLPLLEEHGVDIVFSGHHPHYRRYRPIGSKGKKPILHVTSGGGGGPIGGRIPSPLLAQGINLNHYCVVDVDGNRLRLFARAINGSVIDRFELVKENDRFQKEVMQFAVTRDDSKKIISLYEALLTNRTHELQLSLSEQPQANQKVKLALDLAKLPRGRLEAGMIPEGSELILYSTDESAWKVSKQSFKLSEGKGVFEAVVPANVSMNGSQVNPAAKLKLQLRIGEKLYEPFTATARLSVLGGELGR